MFRLRTALFLVVCAAATACGGSDAPSPASPTPVQNIPFSSIDVTTGTGAEAVAGRTLTVNYTGWFYDSTRPGNKGGQFDTSAGRGPYTFVLGAGNVIAGWDQGLRGMRVGGVRELVIPPSLAYGATGYGPIPPNTTLIFNVELLGVS
jgi:FKBP-type peptidyl-prolyl cis-trans isomerase FkpA